MIYALIAVIVLVFLTVTFLVLRRGADQWPGPRPERMKMLNDAEKTSTGDTSQVPILLSKEKEQHKRARNASDMDALHFGCALAMNPDLFVFSDGEQIAAARERGLKVKEV